LRDEVPEAEYCECIKKNIGPGKSFRHLIDHVPSDSYAAFCDQDDIWYPEKLQVQFNDLKSIAQPAIAASKVKILGSNKVWPRANPLLSLNNSIFENQILGCTMLMNSMAVTLYKKTALPERLMHDQWAYSLIMLYGTIRVVNQPLIAYRLHAGNHAGLPSLEPLQIKKIYIRIHNLLKLKNKVNETLPILSKLALEVDPNKHLELLAITEGLNNGLAKRYKFIQNGGISRSNKFELLILNTLCFIGYFKLNSQYSSQETSP
jgi:hypothetical protein